jgi:hypothetical protein
MIKVAPDTKVIIHVAAQQVDEELEKALWQIVLTVVVDGNRAVIHGKSL